MALSFIPIERSNTNLPFGPGVKGAAIRRFSVPFRAERFIRSHPEAKIGYCCWLPCREFWNQGGPGCEIAPALVSPSNFCFTALMHWRGLKYTEWLAFAFTVPVL